MQPGATFVVDVYSCIAEMKRRDDHVEILIGHYSVAVIRPAATALHDFARREKTACGVYGAADGTYVAKVRESGTAWEIAFVERVADRVRRVALTDTTMFLGSSAEVVAFPSREVIAVEPVDFASSGSQLGVLDVAGLSIFDANGAFVSRTPLASPSALTPDGAGWLVAADGNLLAIQGSSTEVVARVGEVTRIRREEKALIYSAPDGRLFELVGQERKEIAHYAPGFTAFDTNPTLYVDEGRSPASFFAYTQCGCRTRTVDERDGGRLDTYNWLIEITCPVCGKVWPDYRPA